jgi:hypothetical protein
VNNVLTQHTAAVGRRTIGSYVWFALMAGGWAVFLGLLLFSEPTLQELWERLRQLPLLGEGVVWILLFPLVLALAVWNSDREGWLRLLLVAGFALAWSAAFFPRPTATKRRAQ